LNCVVIYGAVEDAESELILIVTFYYCCSKI